MELRGHDFEIATFKQKHTSSLCSNCVKRLSRVPSGVEMSVAVCSEDSVRFCADPLFDSAQSYFGGPVACSHGAHKMWPVRAPMCSKCKEQMPNTHDGKTLRLVK